MRSMILAVLAVALMGAAPKPAAKPAVKPAPAQPALLFAIGTPNGEEQAVKAKDLIEKQLTKAMGAPVRVRIIPDSVELAAALPKGEVDAAWLPPIAFARASTQSKDVKALVKARRNGKLSYRTAYIVRNDSPAKTLPELAGKKVAWVSPSSASGYLFARSLLVWAGKDPDRFFGSEIFAGTHPAVCKAVRAGEVDVGATLADPPLPGKPFEADGCLDAPPISDFRVIAASEPIPNDVIAVGAKLPAKTVAALTDAFHKMAETPEGKALMAEAFRVEAWVDIGPGEFDSMLRALAADPAAMAVPTPAPDKAAEPKPAPATEKAAEPKPAEPPKTEKK